MKLNFFSVLLFEPENELALDFVETINEKLKLGQFAFQLAAFRKHECRLIYE
jgi:hypothetical protein